MKQISRIEQEIAPLREALVEHALYQKLETIGDIRVFMEKHVFAVWDFMSLLKALQQQFTCVSIPWRPAANSKISRFINKIVLDEESDRNAHGAVQSHFEMYLDAMKEVEASPERVLKVVDQLTDLDQLEETLAACDLKDAERNFLAFTFSLIRENEAHKIASAFTFGREDLLSDVFLAILREQDEKAYPQLIYYLERHIELDGDEHGPLALEMIAELCGDDPQKWEEVAEVAKIALTKRLELWDEIAYELTPQEITA